MGVVAKTTLLDDNAGVADHAATAPPPARCV